MEMKMNEATLTFFDTGDFQPRLRSAEKLRMCVGHAPQRRHYTCSSVSEPPLRERSILFMPKFTLDPPNRGLSDRHP